MADIPIPLTDQEVDTSEPTSALMMVGMLIAGFAVFAMTQAIGTNLANQVNSYLGNFIGINPGTGEDADQGVDLL
jgi:hypothetical protein